MKKFDSKGFTLVELLAVIVIMGILMMVAIPSVTRTIENSRKDTFVDIAKSYANAARTQWTADGLSCGGTVSSAVDDGDYYVMIDSHESARTNLPVLVDQGGKSSWGNRDVQGYVRVNISTTAGTKDTTDADGDGNKEEYVVDPRRVTKFYVALTDGTHGIYDDNTLTSDELKRGNVVMSGYEVKKANMTKKDASGKWTGTAACTVSAAGVATCESTFTGGFTDAVTKMKGICVES
jgi:type IV pilus assembly protein PilA